MKITATKKDLAQGISQVLGVVDRRGTMPILAHARLETNGNGAVITATDLELSCRGFIPAIVREPGACTLPACQAAALVRELPDGKYGISLTGDQRVTIHRLGEGAGVEKSDYQVNSLPEGEFPPIPEAPVVGLVALDSKPLREMVARTIYATCQDGLQYHLNGVFWERLAQGGETLLRMVSTDGHRLSLVERPGPVCVSGGDFSFFNLVMPMTM